MQHYQFDYWENTSYELFLKNQINTAQSAESNSQTNNSYELVL